MTLRAALLFSALLALPHLPAAASQSEAPAEALAQEGELPAPWPARLAALAAPRTVVATFTENRSTPLKKRPVVVTGTVRIDRARGLSLAYDQSRAPVVILDEKGLLLRHPDGREQTAPPEAEADLRLLHALFSFDLATLEKSYALAASESAAGLWTLTFIRLPDSQSSYRELVLAGSGDRLAAITLAKTPNLRTDIEISDPVRDSVFSPEDLARYFR